MRSRFYRCSLCDQEFNQSDIGFKVKKIIHEDFKHPSDEVKWI